MTLPPHIEEKQHNLLAFIYELWIPQDTNPNITLLCTSFVHKSYAADYNGKYDFNERLEFLGDAILSAVVAKILYNQFPEREESDLTLYKIALVRAENLAEVALDIGLDKMIFLGNGEEKNNGREKITILCDCLEALLGYLYLDFGVDVVENFVEKYIVDKLSTHTEISVKSYKSHLQEHIQKLHKITPHYIESEIGKDEKTGDILYESQVYMWEERLGYGTGTNKKKAQEQAAKNAYEKLVGNII